MGEKDMEKIDQEDNDDDDEERPEANLRESADRLLDKLEQGGLIKPAPRVNELLERPTHPQFSVEQVVQQERSFAIPYKRDLREGMLPPFSRTGDFLSSTLSEALDHKDLKDDKDKQVIRTMIWAFQNRMNKYFPL